MNLILLQQFLRLLPKCEISTTLIFNPGNRVGTFKLSLSQPGVRTVAVLTKASNQRYDPLQLKAEMEVPNEKSPGSEKGQKWADKVDLAAEQDKRHQPWKGMVGTEAQDRHFLAYQPWNGSGAVDPHKPQGCRDKRCQYCKGEGCSRCSGGTTFAG